MLVPRVTSAEFLYGLAAMKGGSIMLVRPTIRASSSPPGGDGAGGEIQAADAAAPEVVTSPAPVEL